MNTPTPTLTDTDRLNALFTLFGGAYVHSAHARPWDLLREGRDGIDRLIAANPSLLAPAYQKPAAPVSKA